MRWKLLPLFLIGLSFGAQAQECPPLIKLGSVQMTPLNGRVMTVPVTINGVSKTFMLDTAGVLGRIRQTTVRELDLPRPIPFRDARKIGTLGIGGVNTADAVLAYTTQPFPEGAQIDGTLTNQFLTNNVDLDIDFGSATLSLFAPDHCPGKVVYWGASAVGVVPVSYKPISKRAVVASRERRGVKFNAGTQQDIDTSHMTVPVTLDGRPFNGWIDTRAQKSSLSLQAAKRLFGLTPESKGMTKVSDTDWVGVGTPRERDKTYRYKFPRLEMDNIGFTNLEVLIRPDQAGRNNDSIRQGLYGPAIFSNDLEEVPDMTLGMDVLKHLHIYVANKEGKMYFSAVPTVPAASAPAASPALAQPRQETAAPKPQPVSAPPSAPAPTLAISDAALATAKIKCADLGFKIGTEKFGSCVLTLSK